MQASLGLPLVSTTCPASLHSMKHHLLMASLHLLPSSPPLCVHKALESGITQPLLLSWKVIAFPSTWSFCLFEKMLSSVLAANLHRRSN